MPDTPIVLRPAQKGTKCEDVHTHYKVVPGNSSKLRCNICLKSWQEKTAQQLLEKGELLFADSVLNNIPKSVTQIARAATPSLRMHLVKVHGAVEETESRPTKVPKLEEAFAKGGLLKDNRGKAAALACAFNPNLNFSTLDNPWLRQAFGSPCTKAECPRYMFALRNELLKAIKEECQGFFSHFTLN